MYHYPFSAIVGQERLCLALILNAINPRIGGVLIRGQKGTAKSTAARALAEILPEIEVVEGCPYHCHPTDTRLMCSECSRRFAAVERLEVRRQKVPFVTLPLGATEDRLVGSIDVGTALNSGRLVLKPGLMAEANRGILYVDEINLLDDHLVNVLLDAAAMGYNIVEREGLSFVHPARFVLVGTMNPEEGELRPQLTDRFGLAVDVEGISDPEARTEIISRILEFDRSPENLAERFSKSQQELKNRIVQAMAQLDQVKIDRSLLQSAALRALEAGVDGHRADLTMVRVAVTLCAWYGEKSVREEHLDQAAELVLPHRLRRRPFERPSTMPKNVPLRETATDKTQSENPSPTAAPQPEVPPTDFHSLTLPPPRSPGHKPGLGAPGKSAAAGKQLGTRPLSDESEPFDVAASLLAAAVRQGPERRRPVPIIEKRDLRSIKTSDLARRAICFVVDVSGSMAARGRLEAAKKAARRLLEESYQERHLVSLVLANGEKAQLHVAMTRNAELIDRELAEYQPSGKTPLAHALLLAEDELLKAKGKGLSPAVVLLTDGRANVPIDDGGDAFSDAFAVAARIADHGFDSLVVDTENDFINFGFARELAEKMGADYIRSEVPDEEAIVEWVRARP